MKYKVNFFDSQTAGSKSITVTDGVEGLSAEQVGAAAEKLQSAMNSNLTLVDVTAVTETTIWQSGDTTRE